MMAYAANVDLAIDYDFADERAIEKPRRPVPTAYGVPNLDEMTLEELEREIEKGMQGPWYSLEEVFGEIDRIMKK